MRTGKQNANISRRNFIEAAAGTVVGCTAAPSYAISAAAGEQVDNREEVGKQSKGMRAMLRATDFSADGLSYIKQIGVDDVLVYLPDIPGYQQKRYLDRGDLQQVRARLDATGLRLTTVHLGQGDLANLLLGKDGGEQELDNLCRTIKCLGEAEIRVLMYSPLASRAILATLGGPLPGYWENPGGRGGAILKSYDDVRARQVTAQPAGPISAAQLWNRITRLLERIVPEAERAKVYLACHPDDPPVARYWGIEQILVGEQALKRLLAIAPSQYHGLDLCQGTLQESGIDVPAFIRDLGKNGKIIHVELRGVRGQAVKYDEVFMDQGDLSLWRVIQALKEVGYRGSIEIAHVPQMIHDQQRYIANALSVGFVKGLLAAAG